MFFGYQEFFNSTVTSNADIPPVNIQGIAFFGLTADFQKLNGMWIDFFVIVLILVYFNLFNFWLLFEPTEIVRSSQTVADIKAYIDICNQLSQNDGKGRRKLTTSRCIEDFNQQFTAVHYTNSMQKFIYTYYHLFMIAFLLVVSIFNGSLLSFGYFLACMYLINDQKNLLTEYDSRERMEKIIKNFLLPYLLFDIGCNLIYQAPIPAFRNATVVEWAKVIGFEQIWLVYPKVLAFGEQVTVTETHLGMTAYMMKGLAFFFVSTMLQILASHEFREFQHKSISRLEANQTKIGLGLAYRFNNFKCHTVIKQAKEVDRIGKMLGHVKKLILRREKLYSINQGMPGSKRKLTHDTILEESSSDERDKDDGSFDRVKFEKEEQAKVKQIYEEKLRKLPMCFKFYLYLRRNLVSDIFFRQSEEQLDDIVE